MPDPIVFPGQTIRADPINDLVAPQVLANTNSFSVPTGGAYTVLTFTSMLNGNTPTMWNAATPTRLIIPDTGVYLAIGGLTWTGALGAAGVGRTEYRTNTSGVPTPGMRVGSLTGSTGNMQVIASGCAFLNAGDYLELYSNHTAGVNVAISASFGVVRIG